MKVAVYMCNYCSVMHSFPEDDKREEYLCPKCGKEMWYVLSEERNAETELVTSSWKDDERVIQTSHLTKPPVVVTCPYCKSTDTEKISAFSKGISMALLGVLALGETSKEWHCNHCGSDF